MLKINLNRATEGNPKNKCVCGSKGVCESLFQKKNKLSCEYVHGLILSVGRTCHGHNEPFGKPDWSRLGVCLVFAKSHFIQMGIPILKKREYICCSHDQATVGSGSSS
jgi:hypothetical protein